MPTNQTIPQNKKIKITDVENTSEIREEMSKAVGVLFRPGAVVELRALKGKKTKSGYFDDPAELVEWAEHLDEDGWSVYVTLNEVDPSLLARAANTVKDAPRSTSADANITRRLWLPMDFDPIRASGISSTDEEHTAAELRAHEVREYMRTKGWPDPVAGDSGNGCHLLYRIDLPNDRESAELVKNVLEALAFRFDDNAVKLDMSVHNAARIWKLYGTVARKGDSVPDRPHRRSKILYVPKGEVQGA